MTERAGIGVDPGKGEAVALLLVSWAKRGGGR